MHKCNFSIEYLNLFGKLASFSLKKFNLYIKAKEICAERGLGWKKVEWNPNFGMCTW